MFSLSRARFYCGSKKWFIVLIGSVFPREERPLFWNGRWETSCGKFDKKPFLIRFRNRKYPFCFIANMNRTEGMGKLNCQNIPQRPIYFRPKADATLSLVDKNTNLWFKSSLKSFNVNKRIQKSIPKVLTLMHFYWGTTTWK